MFIESQLKAFADKHDILVPQPRKRDAILQKVRSNYEAVAKKVGETCSYPGNWLYESWSESGIVPDYYRFKKAANKLIRSEGVARFAWNTCSPANQ
jgi:hypothetical protein